MLQRRRCRCCVTCIVILVICISVFYFRPFSAIQSRTFDKYKYPDLHKYAKNIGNKLGLDQTLSLINGESEPDLKGVPLRLLMKDNVETPKYLPQRDYLKLTAERNAAEDAVDEKAITNSKAIPNNKNGKLFDGTNEDEGTFLDKKAAPSLVVVSGQGRNTSNLQEIGVPVAGQNGVEGALDGVAILDVKKAASPSDRLLEKSKHFRAQEELDRQALMDIKRNSNKQMPHLAPASIIIVTNRRSGSSFLGQIFNQNPEVFFHFEPLKVTEWKKELYPNGTSLIRNIFKCNFDNTPFLMEMYNRELLHRESSRALTAPPLCNLSQIVNRLKPVNFCPQLRNDIAMDVCKRYRHVVIKTIRMYSLASLAEVLQDKSLNVKVIHLMRDPRGIYISRTKAEKKAISLGKNLDHDVSYVCRRMRRNLDQVESAPSRLQGRYIRVRYEDVAENPMGWTEKLYDFSGIGKVPKEVAEWVRENTQGKSDSNAYSTHRNSALTSQAWRKAAPIDVVEQMQNLCHDVLADLGYLEVNSLEQLRNDSLSLVV